MPLAAPAKTTRKAKVAAVTAALLDTPTIGGMADKLVGLRDRKRDLEADVKKIEDEYNEVVAKLMERLDAEGTDKGAGKKGSVSITTNIVGKIVDDSKFFAYIKKSGHFHLMQRRLSDPAIRELMESKGAIPGIETLPIRRLNLRAA